MEIIFQQYTAIGQRTNNEDFVLSLPENAIFILCDGVGGNSNGEIASEAVCRTLATQLENTTNLLTNNEIDTAILNAEQRMADIVSTEKKSPNMATTLCLLQITSQGSMLAHIGDSRIYHIRNGNILSKTIDHTYVNELIASGFITPEQAAIHPKRNMITRAILANGEHTEADTLHLKDVQENDFFLMCSDGVLEGIDDNFIASHFFAENSVDVLMRDIRTQCQNRSKDNNTAIVVKIKTF